MKRLLFVCICLLLALPGMARAQDEETFSDPNGLYTVPVPTNWTAEALDGYVLLNDPDELINIYITTVEDEPTEEAIAAAWTLVDPDFALEVADTLSPPPPPNVDELVVVTYDTGDTPRIVQAVGQRVGATVYVIMIDGELNAVVQRNAQAQTILTGFQIVGQEETDLSAVDPLPIDETILAELEAYTADLLVRLEAPGAAVAIVQNGEVIYTAAFGVKALSSDEPITPETQFMIGSTTKPITTTMMATLVDDGIITWDEPVVDVLPQFAVSDPNLTQQFTLRNLVCACTGVPRRDLELLFNADELTAADIVASLQTFEFFTDFGETFQYSNQLVATGGYAAAAALDPDGELYTTYLAAMQTRIFDPLGMTNTTFDFDAVEARGDYALPHAANLDAEYYPLPISDEQVLIPIGPAGVAWSTVGDMAQYAITMLNRGVAPDGERLVSEENLLETWQPQVAVSANASYGLGWFVDEYKGAPLYNHGGNTLGFTSDFAFLPDAGFGIVVLSNGQAANIFNEGIRIRLLELVYQQPAENDEQIVFFLEQSEQAMAELEASVGDTPDETDVDAFLGSYSNDALGSLELRYEEDRFVADAGEFVVELRPNTGEDAPPNSFIAFGSPSAGLPFVFVEDGGSYQLVIGANVTEYVFERVTQS